MLAIHASPMNMNPLTKIPNNANINAGIFHHDIVGYIFHLCIRNQKLSIIIKGANMSFGNIPRKLFYREEFFF